MKRILILIVLLTLSVSQIAVGQDEPEEDLYLLCINKKPDVISEIMGYSLSEYARLGDMTLSAAEIFIWENDRVFIYYDANDRQAWYYREDVGIWETDPDHTPWEIVDDVTIRIRSWDEDKQKVSSSFTASEMIFGPPISERVVRNLIGVFGARTPSGSPDITINRLNGSGVVSVPGDFFTHPFNSCLPVDRIKFFEEMWKEPQTKVVDEEAIRRNRAF